MRVLFIAGQGRSGSTLIERALAELPGICALGEATHVWQQGLHDDERCSCGAWFSACEFWKAVGEVGFGGWDRVDRQRVFAVWHAIARTRLIPRLLNPTRRRLALIHEFVDYQTRVYTAAAAVSGARVVIDSSKYAGLGFCLRWAHGLDLRVIHLIRDPRGVAYSWTKHVPRPEADGATVVPRYSPARSALRWNAQNAAVDLLARLGRDGAGSPPPRVPVRRVRYEDFLDSPRHTLTSLADFAGMSPEPSDLDYIGDDHVDLGVTHSASGNPMRFATGRTRLRHDDAWRTNLPAGQQRLVSAVCAPLLAAYGYPVRP
ncbi:sulfotransferase [Phytoactinopolyspora halotolerans]|uniref:Sulfotransferase n=1 Tax=Phytoactinopolyspora halotolerans TaxID=1981512 RepID=A0A6L9S6L7_9ACTN|nr:sulfotransferase [Phytoactinopolyspora halotolerans]NEE00178.1 sulfotransferase [Phytoactinopolyspora halotolerans]